MLPKKHIIYSLIFCLILFIILPYYSLIPYLIFFLSSVLMDIDHYFVYIWRKKDTSLISALKWHDLLEKMNKKEKIKNIPFFHFLHSFEFFILLVILSFFFKYVIYILLGFIFHSILDLIDMKRRNELASREYFTFKLFFKK